MNPPFFDLIRQYKAIEAEIDAAIKGVLNEGAFILGPQVENFEKTLANFLECDYAVGVASGTDALLLSLLALGIGPGDEVITSPFTFVATASSISRSGAVPVFVDIDPNTYNINASLIEDAITDRTKALLPVHLYGQPADMDKVLAIAEKHALFVIEDAAQAVGSSYKGRKVGGIGHAGAVSFFPTKNLGAYGDGGAVLTNDVNVAEKIDLLRRQGARRKYYHELMGINSRLDTLQAAILQVKLRHLEVWQAKRRAIAYEYNTHLEGLNLEIPYESDDVVHSYHQYTIKVPRDRDNLRLYLSHRNIQTMVYYPHCLHQLPIYRELYNGKSFPEAEEASRCVISLPCFPELTQKEQIAVVETLRTFYA